ncbi:hypothetical protein [Streptomyces decoyicus]|uniref:hypothetical protein n=1 Tax=Streptomyces decoyicus TaxID=249567 RepID=UPI000A7E70BC|nr:hypothetical protein [Streptomyces decoyicus]QZY14700.1 hypothetical protein K7C20_05100 [Streptomyces decoyicus]
MSSLTSTARSAWRLSCPCPIFLPLPDTHGFSIHEAEVFHWGLCPDCSTGRNLLSTEFRTVRKDCHD